MRRSLSAYAKALQVDRKTLRAWTARADWKWGRSPATWPSSETIKDWRAINLDRAGGAIPGANLRTEGSRGTAALAMKISAGLKKAERDLLTLRRQVLQGELIPRARLDREILELIGEFRQILDDGMRRLPASLAGASSETVSREAADWSAAGTARLRGLTQRMIELGAIETGKDAASERPPNKNPAKVGAAGVRHAEGRRRRLETRG